MEITLRPYQEECVNIIDNLPPGSYLVQAATALGKTVVFSHIKRQGRMLILSHRDELVHQPKKYFNCSFGVEQAGEHSDGEEVVSASVQSLVRRLERFKPDDFDILITDEAHHAAAPTYRKIFDYFHPRLHIGFTATPNRGDKVKLSDVYQEIVFKKDIRWGIENKWLTPVNCLQVDIGFDLKKVKIKHGDYDPNALERAVNQDVMNGGVAKAYYELAKGQTLIFAVSVAHAHAIASRIEGAVVVSAKTENREEIIERFTNREIPCIVNCMIFTEGTDLPLIETIIMARPTRNSSLYTQCVGRGLRLYPGKEKLTLIDCVGATDACDICTAPSLLGIDMKKVPPRKRDKVEGDLLSLEILVSQLINITPAAWIINARQIDLFAEKNGYNTYGVRYVNTFDGSYLCSLTQGAKIVIQAPDELGRTQLTYEPKTNREKNLSTGRKFKSPKEIPLQKAFELAHKLLLTYHSDEKSLWDSEIIEKWGNKPASEKQINYINRLAAEKKTVYDFDGFDPATITRHEASIVLDVLTNG